MGLSLTNLLSIGGLQAINNIRRGMTKDVRPSDAKFSSSKNQVYISAQNTNLSQSSRSILSGELGLAVSLNSDSSPSILAAHGSAAPRVEAKADPRTSPFVNIDELNRKNRTLGIGDRGFSTTNTAAAETPKLYPLSTNDYADPYEVADVTSQPQGESQKLRGAIVQISKQFLLTNPNPDVADLKTEIDSHLGSGAADLFNVQLVDQGNGKTTVSVDQVQYNDLGASDRETFDTAIASVDQSFGSLDQKRTLEGADIEQNLNQLQSTLGIQGAVLVSNLRLSLNAPGDVQKTLDDFYVQATDLGLSESDQGALRDLVDQLKAADSNVTSSFDSNSLVDDAQVEFTSNRYGPAYSPSTIATNAALTANTIFLAK